MVTAPAPRRIGLTLAAAMALVLAAGMMTVLGASRLKGPGRPAFLGFELVGGVLALVLLGRVVTRTLRQLTRANSSEERFRLTFEEAPIGMALVTLEGRFLRVNRALCDIVGYTPAELAGLTFQGITHPADLEKDLELAGRLARGEISRYQLEKRYIRKDGAVVDILLGGSVVRALDGAPLYFIAQVVDLTQRRRVEERSRRNEEALARAQRVAHLGSWERDLRTQEVWRSPEVYAIYGAEPGPGTDRPDALVELVHPADRRKVTEAVADSARTGAPFELEHRVVRPDGTERFVRLRGECTLEDGVPVRMTGTILDVTDLRRAEREREASLGWLRQVLAQSPAGMILVHGRQGDRIEMNERAQRMIGRPIAAIGQYPDLLVTLDGRPVPRDELPSTRALRGERINWAEYMLRSARGDSIPVAAGAAPLLDETGAVQGAIVIFQDITAVKDLERLRAEWNSIIAHDLRQPLSAITLSAQVLAKRAESPRARAAAEQIASAAGRLGRMINDLLDLSRLDARQLALVREQVDLGLMVRSAVARAELASPEGRFDLRCPDELPPVEADPDRIAQVLDNLLTNAVKYGEPGAPILVEVEATASELAVAVTNRGRGIAAEELPQLFRRFHRSDESRRSGVKGIGLGLHITRALIEAHGGRITAESTPGESTRFRFTLPRP